MNDAVDLGREVGDGTRVVDHVVGVFEFGVEGELGREAGLGVREGEVVAGPESLQLENLGAVWPSVHPDRAGAKKSTPVDTLDRGYRVQSP